MDLMVMEDCLRSELVRLLTLPWENKCHNEKKINRTRFSFLGK